MPELLMSIILITSATLLGFSFSQNLTNRRRNLQKIIETLEKMKTYIGFSSMEIFLVTEEVFKDLKGFGAFTKTPQKDESFTLWWGKCVDSLKRDVGLDAEDKSLLKRFAKGVGISDADSQVSHLDLYIQLFKERLNLATDSETKKSRLYKILGFSLGCVVTLMIV